MNRARIQKAIEVLGLIPDHLFITHRWQTYILDSKTIVPVTKMDDEEGVTPCYDLESFLTFGDYEACFGSILAMTKEFQSAGGMVGECGIPEYPNSKGRMTYGPYAIAEYLDIDPGLTFQILDISRSEGVDPFNEPDCYKELRVVKPKDVIQTLNDVLNGILP